MGSRQDVAAVNSGAIQACLEHANCGRRSGLRDDVWAAGILPPGRNTRIYETPRFGFRRVWPLDHEATNEWILRVGTEDLLSVPDGWLAQKQAAGFKALRQQRGLQCALTFDLSGLPKAGPLEGRVRPHLWNAWRVCV
jgi:hypothetical protein